MEETHNKELVQLKMNQRGNNKYQKLKVQSSANLLKNVTTTRRLNSFSGITVKPTNTDTKGESGESIIVVNSDKLDNSGINTGVINGNQRAKVDDGFNPFLYEPERNVGDFTSKAFDQKLERPNDNALEKEKKLDLLTKKSPNQQGDTTPKRQGQKVVHRKFVYYDQNGKITYNLFIYLTTIKITSAKKYTEIPKELLVYIMRAFNEFEETKKAYLRWLQELQLDIANKTEEEKKRILANPPVPELVVKVPLDEGEAESIQPEDW